MRLVSCRWVTDYEEVHSDEEQLKLAYDTYKETRNSVYARHGRRSVGDGGDASPPTFQLGRDHIGNVPPHFFA